MAREIGVIQKICVIRKRVEGATPVLCMTGPEIGVIQRPPSGVHDFQVFEQVLLSFGILEKSPRYTPGRIAHFWLGKYV